MDQTVILVIYLAVVNSVTLLMYGIDKKRAEYGQWRISEQVLLQLSGIGGGLGALLGMAYFHHKTRKLKFRILVPLTLIIWIFISVYWIFCEF